MEAQPRLEPHPVRYGPSTIAEFQIEPRTRAPAKKRRKSTSRFPCRDASSSRKASMEVRDTRLTDSSIGGAESQMSVYDLFAACLTRDAQSNTSLGVTTKTLMGIETNDSAPPARIASATMFAQFVLKRW